MGDMDFKLAGSREGITALQVGRDRKPLYSKLTPPRPSLCKGSDRDLEMSLSQDESN